MSSTMSSVSQQAAHSFTSENFLLKMPATAQLQKAQSDS